MPSTTFKLACLCLFLLTYFLPVNIVNAADRPNIIFILTDDQRWDSLGCMGNDIIQTPAIDKLSREGVTFENMFCTTSICAVSRATYMTGQYARRHGINDFRTSYTPEQLDNSFPMQLRENGYRTGMIGKWGIGGKLPVDRYDYWKGFPGQSKYFPNGPQGASQHLTEIMRNQSLEFLDGCSEEQPFMLQLYSKAAHCQDGDPWPFQPDPKYNSMYSEIEIPAPPLASEDQFNRLPEFLKTSEARTRWHVRFENPELFQKSIKDYYRLIAGLDETVAAIRKKLDEKGFAENTVIIYTSDNGFYLGDRGLAGKWYMHEESIRLPLIIFDPRLPESERNMRRSEMVLNIDISPTIFDLAGLPIPAKVQGKSLLPLLKHGDPNWRDSFVYEHRVPIKTIPESEGLRTKRWSYVRYVETDPPTEQLFDLEADPLEENDLAVLPGMQPLLNRFRNALDHEISEIE
ncbi:sulfatase [uncultured Rubinisphaera sp.]|uniref:sulfatase family protein n=1 Tax=uncultured Rubinisphaera sp. TaxID=1678686 RepID=UPI0030D7D948